MTFPFHPLANLFPLIEGSEFTDLVASVKAGGLRDAIVIHDGQVLDGRNRQNACEVAEVDARYEPLPADQDPLQFVLDKNLTRRHLNESQRGMVAANLATMRQGERTDVEPSAKLQKVAQADAARRLSVSPRTVADAVKVKKEASPEVRRAVEQGALPVSSAVKLVSLPADEQRRVVEAADPAKAARTEISRHNRDERLEEIVRAGGTASPALIKGRKFSLLYADPPWQFDVWSRETGLEKCPDQHYPTMTVEEICALPISDLVADTALLFLWITVPKLNRMDEIFRAWGRIICDDPEYGIIKRPWKYVSNYNWDKINIGPGRWNRNQHEHLLIARIGDVPAPLPADRARSNYSEASTEHSAKPDYFAELIERQFPTLPKIELFRRGPARPGWEAWGNESVDPATGEATEAA
jgi:N6-adenosine-specific RNA methylase IME4